MTNFYLDKRTNSKGEAPIRVSHTALCGRILTSTGISIAPEKWDAAKQLAREGNAKNPVVNSKGLTGSAINARLAGIRAAFNRLEQDPKATMGEYRAALAGITGKKAAAPSASEVPMLARFDEFISEEASLKQLTAGTVNNLRYFKADLSEYSENPRYGQFDEKGMRDFLNYLRNKRQMNDSSVKNSMGLLKRFIKWSAKKGYCTDTSALEFNPKFKVLKKPVIFLSRDELMKVWEFKAPAEGTKITLKDYWGNEYEKTFNHTPEMINRAKDLFCFCCFTSLRYSDMDKLKRSDIVGGNIVVTTKKTNARIEIPLTDLSRQILDRYKGLPEGRALPHMVCKHLSSAIKDIWEFCGINTPVQVTATIGGQRHDETLPKWALASSHSGRKTFVCYMLSMGVPPSIIMKFTGHKSLESMKPYMDITKEDSERAMLNAFGSLAKEG